MCLEDTVALFVGNYIRKGRLLLGSSVMINPTTIIVVARANRTIASVIPSFKSTAAKTLKATNIQLNTITPNPNVKYCEYFMVHAFKFL